MPPEPEAASSSSPGSSRPPSRRRPRRQRPVVGPPPARPPRSLLTRWRQRAAVALIRLGRLVMPLLAALAGEYCWECGKKITPTRYLKTHHIVEARLWAWNRILCDACIRRVIAGGGHPQH